VPGNIGDSGGLDGEQRHVWSYSNQTASHLYLFAMNQFTKTVFAEIATEEMRRLFGKGA